MGGGGGGGGVGGGDKIVESHGSSHSRGVMILFKPKINVSIDKIIREKNGRYVLCECISGRREVYFCEYLCTE